MTGIDLPERLARHARRPVIFLDMDGVISTHRAYKAQAGWPVPDRWIDKEAVANLNDLCEKSGALIVVSSTWRLNYTADNFLALLQCHGFRHRLHEDWRTKDFTHPITGSSLVAATMRGEEVLEWLSRHPEVTRHVILDDDSDFLARQPLVKTPFETGLSAAHVDLALGFLT